MVANAASLDWQALRKQYLAYFPVRSSNLTALKDAVGGLVALGIDRRTLTEWAVNAGYSPGYVRSLLSRIFCALGLRERRAGAGRKPSRPALRLFLYAWRQYGDDALTALRAAVRLAEAHRDEPDQKEHPLDSRVKPGTGRLAAYCKKQLGRRRATRWHIGVPPRLRVPEIFNPNLQTQIKAKTASGRNRL